jgi:hypothetical protein
LRRLKSRSSPEVSPWTPAIGDRRNRTPRDCDEAAEGHQEGPECSLLACSILERRFPVNCNGGSEVAETPRFLLRQICLEWVVLTSSKLRQRPTL